LAQMRFGLKNTWRDWGLGKNLQLD
jgi:hypothetical protein